MKGVKGKLLKKLKTIKSIGYLKPEKILNALDGYSIYTSAQKSSIPFACTPLSVIQEEEPKKQFNDKICPVQESEIINLTELMKGLDDQESEFDCEMADKENVMPEMKSKYDILEDQEKSGVGERKHVPLSAIDVSTFTRPILSSRTLFDPNLILAFEQAVMEVKAREAGRISRNVIEDVVDESPLKSRKRTETLTEREERSLPGGGDSVVLYTTGLRGIRKTFEDCQNIRSLLENLKVLFFERDISMHNEFKEELWRVMGRKLVPPRLFIKGRYIGGAEEVLGLHEQGKLKPLIEGIPICKNEGPCEGCTGFRFVVCLNCNGSRKIVPEGDSESTDCSKCNENGVIICPVRC